MSAFEGSPPPVDSDSELAASIARAAGERLLAIRREHPEGDQAALKAAGDSGAQAFIAAALAAARPEDAVLSEEAKDDPIRVDRDRVWIVDPLDGTREYSEGRADWAVHIALWVRPHGAPDRRDGGPGELVAGAVAIPGEGLVLSSADAVLAARTPGPLRIAVSRSRPPAIVTAVAAALGAELVPMGSAGVKIAAVVRGQVDAYVHGGGQYEWDSAAPVAVARAAGAWTSRLDGSPLEYNRPDPYLPDLIVCRPELRERILAVIANALAATPDNAPETAEGTPA